MTDDPIKGLMGVYNKKYNCIYVRVPRTGTGSLGTILNIGGGHMPIEKMKWQFNEHPPTGKKWEDVFKFGFCRSPYTRFVSAWYNLGFDIKRGEEINEFIQDKDKMKTLFKEENVLVKPVNEYLCIDGKIEVDYVGRFEDLHNSWNYLYEKFGIIPTNITHVNRTDRPKKELTDKSKEILYNTYKKDFEVFGYDK